MAQNHGPLAGRTRRPVRPHVLLFGHYPLDTLDRAPKVRTYAMAEALAKRAQLTIITGTRSERAPALQEFLVRERLSEVDGVYLESATSTMTIADWRFLSAVRARRIPLSIYIRDAYQRFPDLYPPKSLKERALAVAYAVTCREYQRLATTLFFPTDGLADLFSHAHKELLPPAGRILVPPDLPRLPFRVIYVGANGPHDGVSLLIEAMEQVARKLSSVRLVLITRANETPRNLPAFCKVVEASGTALSPWLWSSSLALIPRPDTRYNRLALPVKLFDYMSHGLPVLTTRGSEAAKLLVTSGAGMAAEDSPLDYAMAIERLLSNPSRLHTMSQHALEAVRQRHNWDVRAEQVLASLGWPTLMA